jgi:DNA-binding GntR family transcriptional regulator
MMVNNTIEPIKRSTLSSVVTERLRELVTQGTYEPGAQLSEVELADRFGVSRGPIREGLQRLVQEGLLRSEPHRGVFIPVLSDRDIADIYLAREAIETVALRLVAGLPDRQRIVAPLLRLVNQMRDASAAQRWDEVADLDLQFHLTVVDAAGSVRLSRMYATLIGETRVLLSMTASHPGREEFVAEHAEVERLLEDGDLDGALGALGHHFVLSRQQALHTHGPIEGPGGDAVATIGLGGDKGG